MFSSIKSSQDAKQLLVTVLDIIQSFVISLVAYILIFHFVAQPQRVVSVSMLPTFVEGDRLIVEKISYRLGDPARGHVVVFRYPENEDIILIKRIIGLPGETITIREGAVYINETRIEEAYTKEQNATNAGSTIEEDKPFVIPANEYVVMGDNRTQSGDSRIWGTVSIQNIIGKAFFRFWPINSTGFVSVPTY